MPPLLAASVPGAGGGEMADGPLDGHAFDLATAVRGGPDRWEALVDGGWGVGDRPNGGYLLALATRAALQAVDQPHPIAVSAHFVAPPVAGPAELAVTRLRAGRSLSTTRVTLAQEQRPRLEALVSAGTLDLNGTPAWQRAPEPPALPPVAECISGRPELPDGVRVGRGADPLGLLQMVDALPPASFELGIQAWAPTVELTVYVRGLPAPGWLACVVRGQLWQDGWFDEEAEVWDAGGHLVAQSRQLAGAQIGR